MDKKANNRKDTTNKRQASLNQRANSAASDTHKPVHASSPAAIKLNLHDIKISAKTTKTQQKKIALPKNTIEPPKNKFPNKQSFKISNAKTISTKYNKKQSKSPVKNKPTDTIKTQELISYASANSISSSSSNNAEPKDKIALAFTERSNINADDDLLIFSSRDNPTGRKSLVSLCLKPNSSVAFHLGQQLQGKNSFIIKKSTEEVKKVNLNNTDAVKHAEEIKKWETNPKVRHINNKTDIDFNSASTTEKTSMRETSLQHLNNDLGMLKDKVKGAFLDCRAKLRMMAERTKQLIDELAETKSRLSKYEKV